MQNAKIFDIMNLRNLVLIITGTIFGWLILTIKGHMDELETQVEVYRAEVYQIRQKCSLEVEYNTDSSQVLISLIR